MSTNYFKKEFKVFKTLVTFERFRIQNRYLPLPHKLFKPGIHTHKSDGGNVYFVSIVISNYRLLIIK